MANTITMKVPVKLHEELKEINKETKIPMIYILEKAWEEYKKMKEQQKGA